jgi:predicted phage terminase large subunit-like protein
MREASRKGIHLPIEGVKHKISKEQRIKRLSSLIENGILQFKKTQETLIDQLTEFPKGSHDDLPDALEMAVTALESPTKTKSATARRRRYPYV